MNCELEILWVSRRNEKGSYNLLRIQLIADDPQDFRKYTRMNKALFLKLLRLVKPMITKQDIILRESIKADKRLALTLRFLADLVHFPPGFFNFNLIWP